MTEAFVCSVRVFHRGPAKTGIKMKIDSTSDVLTFFEPHINSFINRDRKEVANLINNIFVLKLNEGRVRKIPESVIDIQFRLCFKCLFGKFQNVEEVSTKISIRKIIFEAVKRKVYLAKGF